MKGYSFLEQLPKDVLVMKILYLLPPSACVFVSRCSKRLHEKTTEYINGANSPFVRLRKLHLKGTSLRTCAIWFDDPWFLLRIINHSHFSDEKLQEYVILTMELCAICANPPYNCVAFLGNLLQGENIEKGPSKKRRKKKEVFL